jgi:hypothetical protein
VSGLVGVVLAAGAGTRLRPLTELLPKALCPVDGVPLVDRAIERVTPHVDALAVNAHHHAQRLADHVRDRAYVSVEAPVALGTAGALGALRAVDRRARRARHQRRRLPRGRARRRWSPAGTADAYACSCTATRPAGDFGPTATPARACCRGPWWPGSCRSRPRLYEVLGGRCGSAASWI